MKNVYSLIRQFGFCLLLFVFASPLSAEKAKSSISVKAEVDRAFITIGDRVEYTVTIRRDPDIQILSSIPPPSSDIFKIKTVKDFDREEDGQVVTGRVINLTTYVLGDYVLDPLTIEYRVGDGETKTISTEPIYITVQSVAAGEEKTDIRGIKPVLPVPSKILTWIILILVLIALAVGGFVAYRILKKKPDEELDLSIQLTPEEQAIKALTQLFESDLLKKGKTKVYYLTLSEILREYFEKRFGILAVESTTDEIVKDLKQKKIDSALRTKIQTVLEAADLAKFAKWKPEPAEIITLNKQSKQIVEEAAPKEVKSGV